MSLRSSTHRSGKEANSKSTAAPTRARIGAPKSVGIGRARSPITERLVVVAAKSKALLQQQQQQQQQQNIESGREKRAAFGLPRMALGLARSTWGDNSRLPRRAQPLSGARSEEPREEEGKKLPREAALSHALTSRANYYSLGR